MEHNTCIWCSVLNAFSVASHDGKARNCPGAPTEDASERDFSLVLLMTIIAHQKGVVAGLCQITARIVLIEGVSRMSHTFLIMLHM